MCEKQRLYLEILVDIPKVFLRLKKINTFSSFQIKILLVAQEMKSEGAELFLIGRPNYFEIGRVWILCNKIKNQYFCFEL